MLVERCDHNRFAAELSERFVEHRVRELAAFEARARGLVNPFFQTAATAAKAATQPGATTMNQLFRPAEITTAKLKMALMGFQGSGKTYTGTSTAIGMVQLMRQLNLPEGKLPIAFADTEEGLRLDPAAGAQGRHRDGGRQDPGILRPDRTDQRSRAQFIGAAGRP
jgi:hypothetical protein